MIKPTTLGLIFTGGGLITLRNYLTEKLFGLDWRGIGRFTTGVYKEELEDKRLKYQTILSEPGITFSGKPEFEKMYSIRIKAGRERVLQEVAKFGDEIQQYFRPRMIRVKRVRGEPLKAGSVLRYEVLSGLLKFSIVFERMLRQEIIIYRVASGFPKGGALIFEIEAKGDQYSLLSIYVAFNFPRGRHVFSFIFWGLFKALFPAYLHDVLWNHSLCKLKDLIESEP
jgi:hypothetical protein